MSDTVISVENISKRYILGHRRSKDDGFRHIIEDALRRPFQWLRSRREATRQTKEEFWALRDVSFEVKKGDVLGIIGRNGAGKSTLLKILSRITEPTSGSIMIDGRVASLLEVGTGFHPELTGRENIFLNGAILGMSRVEIRQKFDEIVAFSEVEKFLDTPVKRYSSGMYVRLAFAVAAHLEPEILIIDEVLAVGDVQFQKKCLGKMDEVAKGGRTVLFVSHNMAAIQQLTTRCVFLKGGRVEYIGPSADSVNRFLQLSGPSNATNFDVSELPRAVAGTFQAKIFALRFDRATPRFSTNECFEYIATVKANENIPFIRFSMTVYASDGIAVGCCFGDEKPGLKAGAFTDFKVTLPDHHLAPGQYYCGIAIGRGNHRTGFVDYDIVLDTLPFEILPPEGDAGTLAHWHKNWGNIVFNQLHFQPIT